MAATDVGPKPPFFLLTTAQKQGTNCAMPYDFNECLATIGITAGQLAEMCRIPQRTAYNWRLGKGEPTPEITAWLIKAARWHALNPPPTRNDTDDPQHPMAAKMHRVR